jgi:hypothetical protein
MSLPSNPSAAFIARNPHLYGAAKTRDMGIPITQSKPSKRLRQNPKPLMNKLETEWFNRLKIEHPHCRIHAQDKTFRLANGLRYTPDFTAIDADDNDNLSEMAWEVKGKWVDGDSFPKLKMAATVWPEVQWTLVWKENGVWKQQRILP